MSGIANVLLVSYAGGSRNLQVTAQPSVDEYGRREAFLSLDAVANGQEAIKIARAMLVDLGHPVQTLTVTSEPTGGDEAYDDYNVGDWVSAPDLNGAPQSLRVRSLTVTEDELGVPIFVPEVGTLAEERQNRLSRWLSRMALGTVGGRSESASPGAASPGSGAVRSRGPKGGAASWGGFRLVASETLTIPLNNVQLLPTFNNITFESGVPILDTMQPSVLVDGIYRVTYSVAVSGPSVAAAPMGISLFPEPPFPTSYDLLYYRRAEAVVNLDADDRATLEVSDLFSLRAGDEIQCYLEPPAYDVELNVERVVTVELVGPWVAVSETGES